ncbi:MAG: hypothetical protein H6953_08815 [Chromatiaceae bacterium]|nr:hypothetical protein [Chromatiaceae bacterium]MCP5315496.1 hypothetical protein [Chromatiaceae bacterium]
MRRILLLGLAIAVAACAPVQEKPEPPPVAKAPRVKPRFDPLAMLEQDTKPERDGIRDKHRYDRSIGATSVDGLKYFFYEPGGKRTVVGFSFLNDGSPTINPAGLKRKGARREYAFLFSDRARENIHLAVNDDVKLSGRFSHDNMFRELHFFPRRQLPSAAVEHDKGRIRVTLPTGEPVYFDQDSMELTGGALSESPIDFNKSRHLRHNPEVRYTGQYLALTVAQRGEAPRRAKVWGQTKFAEVYYPAKYPKRSCKLSPKFIWDQKPKPGDNDPKLTMLYQTDQELFAMVEKQCHWDLSELKDGSTKLAGVK